MHNIVGFGLQSLRVSTETIRLLALVFYERKSTWLPLVDYSLIEKEGE